MACISKAVKILSEALSPFPEIKSKILITITDGFTGPYIGSEYPLWGTNTHQLQPTVTLV